MSDNYTREPIEDMGSQVVHTSPQMREERVLNATYVPKPLSESSGQLANNETPPAETKAPEESVKLSPQVTALARKEAKFRQAEKALKDKEALIAAKEAKLAQLEEMEKRLAAKDFSVIEDKVNYDEYAEYLLNKRKDKDPKDEALKKLEDEVNGIKKASEENIAKQFEAAVQERRVAVTKLVDSSEDFPAIKKLKQHEAVVQHILDTWENETDADGKPIELSPEDAAKEVEEFLKQEAKTWAQVLEMKPPVEEKKQLPPMKTKTLTNQMTATEVARPKRSYSLMSEEERYKEARARAEEKLRQQGRI